MKEVKTDKAPKAVGPYSQAIVAGSFVFCSGQIPLEPKTNALVKGGIKEQTEQALLNLQAVLKKAGTHFGTVTSVNVYLQSMNDFAKMNDVYTSFFKSDPMPARATVGVSALPKGALVEISCIAYLK